MDAEGKPLPEDVKSFFARAINEAQLKSFAPCSGKRTSTGTRSIKGPERVISHAANENGFRRFSRSRGGGTVFTEVLLLKFTVLIILFLRWQIRLERRRSDPAQNPPALKGEHRYFLFSPLMSGKKAGSLNGRPAGKGFYGTYHNSCST
jgi:hypothetical protein